MEIECDLSMKCCASIKFADSGDVGDPSLRVELTYEHLVTEEDYEQMLSSFQVKFSYKAGRHVPREEISVEPKVGELSESRNRFIVELGSPLYVGLKDIHKRAPYVLPKLIEALDRDQTGKELGKTDGELVRYLVSGLADIVEQG